MKNPELLKLGESLVKHGQNSGADEVQISITDYSDFDVTVRNGEIEKLQEASSKSMSIKVIKDHKTSTASSSDFNADTLKELVANAVKRTAYGNEDEFSGLPDLSEIKVKEEELKLYDPKILELTPEKKIEIAKMVEDVALKMDNRINNSYGGSFSSGHGTRYLVNSIGFSGSYSTTGCSFNVNLIAGPTDDSVQGGWYTFNRFFDKLEDIESVAKKAVERTVRQLNPQKVKTQNVPIVFEPQQANSILGFLYQCINGDSVYQGRTFLAEKLNEKIANSNVNIIDNGLMPGLSGSKPFDGEGVPAQKTDVIQNGTLKSFLLDTYSARKLKMKSTGNGSGPNNFYLENGNKTPDEIIKSVNKGLYLTMTMGQGTNPMTGDISKGAAGLWIENGKIVYPVAEITISGNLGEILQNIEMTGNDLEFRGGINSPTIKVTGITVGGK
ncbi:TldD/PmbA family protein [candidate division KSB1 bacterium]